MNWTARASPVQTAPQKGVFSPVTSAGLAQMSGNLARGLSQTELEERLTRTMHSALYWWTGAICERAS
eukprot:3678550-Rhodomonas_salina.2